MNKIMVTSDQHSNWDALEKIYKKAQEFKTSLIINGDIVGDYGFDNFRQALNILYPKEIINYEVRQALSQSERHLNEEEINELYKKIIEEKKEDLIRHKTYGIKLFYLYVETAAKKLANLIDKYNAKTYFLLGNHEPIFFHSLVEQFLENKELYVDLNKKEGIINADGFNICGISNTRALMPHVTEIFEGQELLSNFLHQLAPNRKVLTGDEETYLDNIKWDTSYKEDFDWKRIIKTKKDEEILKNNELDIFITHGQIGKGKWKDNKIADLVPTLFSAIALCSQAKLCIDGHLHTSYEMINCLNIKTIRAVGNKAYLITKDEIGNLNTELIEVDAEYDYRGTEFFEDLEDVKKRVFE